MKISIDEAFFFPEVVGHTENNQTSWGEDTFPLVELAQTENDYTLTFIVYRNGVLIGTAKTTVRYGQSLKGYSFSTQNKTKLLVQLIPLQPKFYTNASGIAKLLLEWCISLINSFWHSSTTMQRVV